MSTDNPEFRGQRGASELNSFERRFARVAARLGLGDALQAKELSLLCEATLFATLCNIAFNGLGGCGGEIKAEREPIRIALERQFMSAREEFCATSGWKALPLWQQTSVHRIFFNVFVTEDNLAGS